MKLIKRKQGINIFQTQDDMYLVFGEGVNEFFHDLAEASEWLEDHLLCLSRK